LIIVKDRDKVKILITKENDFFLNEINLIKDFLDKFSDICENEELLDHQTLVSLKEFLETEQNYLAEHIRKLSFSNL